MKLRTILVQCLLIASLASPALAYTPDRLAFVDVDKVMKESNAGKMGQAHIEKVQKLLQEAMDKAIAANKDKEIKAQIQAKADKKKAVAPFNVAQANQNDRLVLQRELQAQVNAVQVEIHRLISEAVTLWLDDNGRYGGVFPKASAFAITEDADETEEIMELMQEMTPKFPALPQVNVAK